MQSPVTILSRTAYERFEKKSWRGQLRAQRHESEKLRKCIFSIPKDQRIEIQIEQTCNKFESCIPNSTLNITRVYLIHIFATM